MAKELIKMVRCEEAADGGPTEADVHPDEVAGYALGGFVVAGDGPDAATDRKGKK